MRHHRHNLRHHQSDATTTGRRNFDLFLCFCFSGMVISITVNVTAQVTRFYILCASIGGQPHFFCLLTGLGKTTQMHYSWQDNITRLDWDRSIQCIQSKRMGGWQTFIFSYFTEEGEAGRNLSWCETVILVADSVGQAELNVSMPCHRIRKMEEEYDWRIEGVGRMNNVLRKNLQKE